MCGCLSHAPHREGPGLQPRHVPWLGIEPMTLWFIGWHLVHWAIPARSEYTVLKKGHFKHWRVGICWENTFWNFRNTCLIKTLVWIFISVLGHNFLDHFPFWFLVFYVDNIQKWGKTHLIFLRTKGQTQIVSVAKDTEYEMKLITNFMNIYLWKCVMLLFFEQLFWDTAHMASWVHGSLVVSVLTELCGRRQSQL